ncbi:MAG: pseudouridine synthase [Sandaracinus sp.]
MSGARAEPGAATAPSGAELCALAARCPGCPAIALPAAEQAARKAERLRAALARFAELGSLAVPPVTTEAARSHYRTRTKWVVDREGRIGLYARGTHDVVDLASCPIVRPSLARVVAALRSRLGAHAALDPATLRGLDLREACDAQEAVLVSLTYERGRAPSAERLAELERELARALAAEGAPLDVSVSTAEHDGSPRVLGTYRIDPARARPDRIGAGPSFLAAHGSFVQAHRDVAAAIHDRVSAAVRTLSRVEHGRPLRVLELYAGSGALALRLAAEGADVTALERFVPAIELARASATHAGLDARFRAIAGDAAEVLVPASGLDAVVVNPPRRGLAAPVREALVRSRARLVAYVACDPETLARDLAVLARAGYRARSVEGFDMMPQTFEVETLALIEPAEPWPVAVIAEGALADGGRWIAVDKAPHEPTTPHPEHVVSLLDRVRRLPGYAEATPVHRLDLGTSGVCLFGATPRAVAPVARALAGGDKTYVALVRGIPREKGTIRRALREEGRELAATTRYRRREVIAGHGLIEARPEEGRMHQIRRHLASIGHPVVGDARYGHAPTNRHFEESAALDRPFLHCARIALSIEGREHVLEAPLAPDLRLVLDRR